MERRTFFDYFGVEYYADNLKKVKPRKPSQDSDSMPVFPASDVPPDPYSQYDNYSQAKPIKPRKNAHIEILGWDEIRLDILTRDGRLCRACGGDSQLTVHHIDQNRANNHPDNLVTLCWSCHRKVHNKKILSPTN